MLRARLCSETHSQGMRLVILRTVRRLSYLGAVLGVGVNRGGEAREGTCLRCERLLLFPIEYIQAANFRLARIKFPFEPANGGLRTFKRVC